MNFKNFILGYSIGTSEVLEQPKGTFGRNGASEPGRPGGGGHWRLILFFVAAAIIVANQVKKENPDLKAPADKELFEKLPDNVT